MKKLIASVAAAALAATPVFAAPTASSTKTVTTKTPTAKATTTVTTKVTPTSTKGKAHARVKRHRKHHVAKASMKKAPAKKSTETTKG
jgi:Ni/Co efflux regulator RcnB